MRPGFLVSIETSSLCELSCQYCVNRDIDHVPGRKRGIMTDEIFEATMEVLAALCASGTQERTIAVSGLGEPLLDPQLPERISRVKEVIGPWRETLISTNGIALTKALAERLLDAGLDKLDISPHNIWHAARALQTGLLAGFLPSQMYVNPGSVMAPHDWAGQIDWLPAGPVAVREPCKAVETGRIYVQSDGMVTSCCYDYRRLGLLGTVEDPQRLLTTEIKPYELCASCHEFDGSERRETAIGQTVLCAD